MKNKNEWVQIEQTILTPTERAEGLPEETRICPYVMRVNGHLLADAEEGALCEIRTLAGRVLRGRLLADAPAFNHSYGRVIGELIDVRCELRQIMREYAAHA